MKVIKHFTTIVFIMLFARCAFGQGTQIAISKVSSMPNLPLPYVMRDWKTVAKQYDSIIYSLNASGQYLPLMHLKSSGRNYPSLQPILLDSYVGVANAGSQAEGINIIPSVVGASLVGINKANQDGTDWVSKTKDFFNKANNQNIYLNGYSAGSGGDWWYDLMPNVFFYQLYSQYPNTTDFQSQLETVANQWLAAVKAMGGSVAPWSQPNLDVRAFAFSTMTATTSGIHEPEGAGPIGWLLYNAYIVTGKREYLEGAQLAIAFLNSRTTDPAYEIQLPYGTLIAARMNAELGAHYNISKMINWSFDQSAYRNWGTIVGKWGDAGNVEVSGLVGEVDNASTGYAFAMNGYQQAAALVPLVKYDKRFAHDIAKWTLNLANASRLFYSSYLPSDHQDSYTWSSAHDKKSAIAYESLKQLSLDNIKLYATGDALRTGGAATNLGVYGSSHVGYMAALIDKTDVDGILLLDVNKTDFFGKKPFPSYLVYNPNADAKQVTLPLGGGSYDLYDAISETVIQSGASGNYALAMAPDQVRLLVYLPAGSSPQAINGKLMVGNNVADYHYGYDYGQKLRIRSLSAGDTIAAINTAFPVYASVEKAGAAPTFSWRVNGVAATPSADSVFHWTTPAIAGDYWIRLNVGDGTTTQTDSIKIKIVNKIPVAPVITDITADSSWYYAGSSAIFICKASNPGYKLTYSWTVSGGSIDSQKDSVIHWTAPATDGMYSIKCVVSNTDDLTAEDTFDALVKIKSHDVTTPIAYYPLDGDFNDYSGGNHNATGTGVKLTTDPRGQANEAYRFVNATDIITVPNASSLNFTDKLTLSFWVKVDVFAGEEYVISHGSYEERYKVSITPSKKVRWTVNSNAGTYDLDSKSGVVANQYYFIAVAFTGYSMEVYFDGILDSFLALDGQMNTTSKALTFGQKDISTQDYHLFGSLDEVRLYNAALSPAEILDLRAKFNTPEVVTGLEPAVEVSVYPNPSHGVLYVKGLDQKVVRTQMMDLTGRVLPSTFSYENALIKIEYPVAGAAVMLLRVETETSVSWKKIISN